MSVGKPELNDERSPNSFAAATFCGHGGYYMLLRNSTGYLPDTEGLLASSRDELRRMAITNIRSLHAGELRSGSIDLRRQIEIIDDRGQCVLMVPFSDTVLVTPAELAR